MPNLLDKLNTLVKSSLNNFVDETAGKLTAAARGQRLGKGINGEIVALRQRIDKAISDQDAMKLRVATLEHEIAEYDQQIDAALQRGDDPNARLLSQQMQRQQRQMAFLQADLDEHRRATSALIQHVNQLEALVADVRREEAAKADQMTDSTSDQQADPEPGESIGESLSNLLRDARERVESMLPAQEPVHHIPINIHTDDPTITTSSTSEVAAESTNDTEIDADLAKRRSRLSGPTKPNHVDSSDKPQQ
jgi:phage shock protein A